MDKPSSETPDVRYVLVLHGAGRGRFNPTADNFLRRLRESGSALNDRLEVVRTGKRARPRFDGRGVIVFFLADPLKELYPDCYAEAAQWRDAARATDWRILNDPDALSHSSKDRQAALWRDAAIPSPQTVSAGNAEALYEEARSLRSPLLIRESRTHSQDTIRLCRNDADIAEACKTATYPAVASELIDVREEWRRAESNPILAEYHHKKRAMAFDGFVMPHHLFLSESIIVGGATCTLTAEHGKVAALKRLAGLNHRRFKESVKADLDYAFGPAEAPDVMRRAVKALGLDIAAIDYATRPNGEVILWEANPFFALPFEPLFPLPRARKLRYRMNRIFDALAQAIEKAAD